MTELYDPSTPELLRARTRAKEILGTFAATGDVAVLRTLFAELPDDAVVEPPFYCDYGSNIRAGARFYAGARSVIGAGSVVTRDVPADVVAVGNPCRVIRAL